MAILMVVTIIFENFFHLDPAVGHLSGTAGALCQYSEIIYHSAGGMSDKTD